MCNKLGLVFSYSFITLCLCSGDEDEEADEEFGSAAKKRRVSRNVKVRKSTTNKYDLPLILGYFNIQL